MTTYYLITAILALINFILIFLDYSGKKINYYFTILSILMTLSCGGYLALSISTDLSEAVLANKLSYLGGCFVPPVVLFSICTICNFKVIGYVRTIIYAFSMFAYIMVLTTGYNDFYYTEISLGTYGDATILLHTYGVGHSIFYVILYGYMFLQILLLIHCLARRINVSRKNIWLLIGLEIVNVALFFISRSLDSAFEIMPLMYVLDGWILIYLHRRIIMYNIDDCITASLEKQQSYGYIIFDNNKNYLGCNDLAKQIIPEVEKCRVDGKVKDNAEMNEVLIWLDKYTNNKGDEYSYENEGKHYQCMLRRFYHKSKACGYIVEMQEDTEHWNYLKLLSNYNFALEEEVKEKTEHISNIQSQILVGMADMVENRDDNTGGHIKRTSDVIKILINTIQEHSILSLDEQFCKDIIKAAPMHDLGKIAIDDKILRKPARLTDEEFAIMQTHAEKSAELVENILSGVEEEHLVNVAINVARHHHEKWSGAGYPMQLKGEEIPLEARIMAIADVYDALVSKRCYKEAMSFEKAYEVMKESMGSHFDPNLEQVFELSRGKLEKYYSQI